MRFLLDENLSYRICGSLKASGHEAVHVNDIGLAGAEDAALMAWATKERSVIISCDHDFVQLLFESGDSGPSVILTREVQTLPSAELGELLLTALSAELEELLAAGAIATLTRDRVRVRPLPLRMKV
jgi:predicted nuclease of predicted toxin-antitoxin system